MISVSKSKINSVIIRILASAPTDESALLESLFRLQYFNAIPLATFWFDDYKKIQAPEVERSLDDLEALSIISRKDNISLTSKGIRIYNREILNPLRTIQNGIEFQPFRDQKERDITIGNETFKIIFQSPLEISRLTEMIFPSPILGVAFGLPPKHSLFKRMITLCQNEHEQIFLAEEEAFPLTKRDATKNFNKLKGWVFNKLGNWNDRFTNHLEIFQLAIRPYSNAQIFQTCDVEHSNLSFSGKMTEYSRSKINRCSNSDCFERIATHCLLLVSEKIYNAWRNCALFEWYVSSLLKRAGFPNVFWHIRLETGEEIDVLGYNQEHAIIIECTRAEADSSKITKSQKQLLEVAKALESSSLKMKKVIFTLANESFRLPNIRCVAKSDHQAIIANPALLIT